MKLTKNKMHLVSLSDKALSKLKVLTIQKNRWQDRLDLEFQHHSRWDREEVFNFPLLRNKEDNKNFTDSRLRRLKDQMTQESDKKWLKCSELLLWHKTGEIGSATSSFLHATCHFGFKVMRLVKLGWSWKSSIPTWFCLLRWPVWFIQCSLCLQSSTIIFLARGLELGTLGDTSVTLIMSITLFSFSELHLCLMESIIHGQQNNLSWEQTLIPKFNKLQLTSNRMLILLSGLQD